MYFVSLKQSQSKARVDIGSSRYNLQNKYPSANTDKNSVSIHLKYM